MTIHIPAFLKPGIWEIVVIALIIVVIFGARRLPDLGKTIGTAVRNFQKSLKGDDADHPQ